MKRIQRLAFHCFALIGLSCGLASCASTATAGPTTIYPTSESVPKTNNILILTTLSAQYYFTTGVPSDTQSHSDSSEAAYFGWPVQYQFFKLPAIDEINQSVGVTVANTLHALGYLHTKIVNAPISQDSVFNAEGDPNEFYPNESHAELKSFGGAYFPEARANENYIETVLRPYVYAMNFARPFQNADHKTVDTIVVIKNFNFSPSTYLSLCTNDANKNGSVMFYLIYVFDAHTFDLIGAIPNKVEFNDPTVCIAPTITQKNAVTRIHLPSPTSILNKSINELFSSEVSH